MFCPSGRTYVKGTNYRMAGLMWSSPRVIKVTVYGRTIHAAKVDSFES